MKKVAITGGISSGKSTVCRLLASQGSYIVDSDKIVHHLLSSDTQIREKVIGLLGEDILTEGQIDRSIVASKVFSHPETLKSLELILHPAVFDEMERQYQTVKNDPNYILFVAEVPLLYETQSAPLFDAVAVVLAEKDLCKKRFIESTKNSGENFDRRMQRQMQPSQKAAKAQFVLINNGSLQDLEEQVTNFLTKLRSN